VTLLTFSSVVWADRMVATSSSNGLLWSRAQRSVAVPGYSSARRSATMRARPFGLRGRRTVIRPRLTVCIRSGGAVRRPTYPHNVLFEVVHRLGGEATAAVQALVARARVAGDHSA